MPNTPYVLLLALVVFFTLYLAYEIWRWFSGNPSELTPGQFRRRLAGGLFLELSLLMWLFFRPLVGHRPAQDRLLYLSVLTLCTIIPIFLAIREFAFVLRQYASSRGELMRELARDEASASPLRRKSRSAAPSSNGSGKSEHRE